MQSPTISPLLTSLYYIVHSQQNLYAILYNDGKSIGPFVIQYYRTSGTTQLRAVALHSSTTINSAMILYPIETRFQRKQEKQRRVVHGQFTGAPTAIRTFPWSCRRCANKGSPSSISPTTQTVSAGFFPVPTPLAASARTLV